MTRLINLSISILTLAFAQIGIACELPEGISAPDGASATEQEMNEAGQAYHQFMIAMQLYQVCLDNDANQARANASNDSKEEIEARENEYAARHNAASNAMNQATITFERAIGEYKARQ